MITGGQFVPLAKILGDIFILSGTDKLIFIQHFTFIQASQQKHYVILVIQEKLSYWCQDFFSSYLNRGSITILYTTKHFAAESRPGIPLQSSIPFLIILLVDIRVLILLLVLAQTSRAADAKGFVFLDFRQN